MAKLSTRSKPKPTNGKAKPAPRERTLPGMEDRANKVLEGIAIEYAEIRDQRMALNKDEATLKQRALGELKRLGRQGYHRNGIDISIVPGEETLRVRVSPPPAAQDDAAVGDATEESA